MSRSIPEWVPQVREKMVSWLQSVMAPKHFGLFKDCVDSEVPHNLMASAVGLTRLMSLRSWRIEDVPGYSEEALKRTVDYVRGCQQPESGLFIDPYLDERFSTKSDDCAYLAFRRAVTNYAHTRLSRLDSGPLYEYSPTGRAGRPDPQA